MSKFYHDLQLKIHQGKNKSSNLHNKKKRDYFAILNNVIKCY